MEKRHLIYSSTSSLEPT